MNPTPTPYAATLDELVTMGMDLARAIYADAMTAGTPQPEQIASFDRMSRTVRRTVLLARRLAEVPPLAAQRAQARARVIREVEDAITCEHGDTEHADALRAELAERLETPGLDEELDLRPMPDIIADIRHDLGLEAGPGSPPWRRRRPAEVRELHRRAAAGTVRTAPPRRSALTLMMADHGTRGPADGDGGPGMAGDRARQPARGGHDP